MTTINHHDRQVYKKSYLKNVHCLLTFETIKWTSELKDAMTVCLSSKGYTIKNTGELPIIQAQKNTVFFVLSDKVLIVKTDKSDYGCFESFKTLLTDVMMELLNLAGIKTILSCIFQKNNSYRLNKQNVGIKLTKEVVLSTLFTHALIDSESPFVIEDNEVFYITQYKYDDNGDVIIVELIINALTQKKLPVELFLDNLTSMNNKIFDLWFESIEENVRKSMEI